MKILFQGDSITDAARVRDNDFLMGSGYPTIVGGALAAEYPGRVESVNRAVSGDRIVDLYARWRADGVNCAPDVISILVGVNDVLHEMSWQNGVESDRFEQVYDMILAYSRKILPDVRFILMEPFVLPSGAADEKWDKLHKEVRLRAEATKRVAEKYGAVFVPLQDALDEACLRAPASWWLFDGVHPTSAGHTLIAGRWLEAFRRNFSL